MSTLRFFHEDPSGRRLLTMRGFDVVSSDSIVTDILLLLLDRNYFVIYCKQNEKHLNRPPRKN